MSENNSETDLNRQSDTDRHQAYWRANLRLAAVLLVIWFTVSFGFGILLVEELNQFAFFGFKLGFWWAQQGAIYVFIVLIFIYAWRMKKIDHRHSVDDDEESG
ncbi:MAG: DUF4212 domain-containing protein [Pseudomonadales bacterium]|jgi:putative solute:sodium symporter small subunit|nr:DUF4212 domain-containing protein [Pseudomonadales bacterium]MDP6472269.1 DUF4212 domain-containing protein [Pseudomonadales bacterium]MDP6828063.1 DUF4212 domain-containing protein [Pseudomonadales bacterium]MDP6972574.1 DUF4212 domain-containing protein [Pseudomonadales bacterium]|tara:strand:- start:37 stop:345 length:309 start_codon:yes stop_codon:yes gene_type:complete